MCCALACLVWLDRHKIFSAPAACRLLQHTSSPRANSPFPANQSKDRAGAAGQKFLANIPTTSCPRSDARVRLEENQKCERDNHVRFRAATTVFALRVLE